MFKCPNTTIEDYIELSNRVGSVAAHSLFNEFNEDYDAIKEYLDKKQLEPLSKDERVAKEVLDKILEKLKAKTGIDYSYDKRMSALGKFNGKVVINPERANLDTNFHEYLHPFIHIVKTENPALYLKLSREVKHAQYKGKSVYDFVKDKYKNNKREDGTPFEEKDFIEEAIVTTAGLMASEEFLKNENNSALIAALKKLWEKIQMYFNDTVLPMELTAATTIKDIAKMMVNDKKIDLSMTPESFRHTYESKESLASDSINSKFSDIQSRVKRLSGLYEKRKANATSDKELEEIGKVIKNLNKKQDALNSIQGVLDYIKSAQEIVEHLNKSMQSIKDDPKNPENIKKLSTIQKFNSIFNNLKNLQTLLIGSQELSDEDSKNMSEWAAKLNIAKSEGREGEFLDDNPTPVKTLKSLEKTLDDLYQLKKGYEQQGASLLANKLWKLIDSKTVEQAKKLKAELIADKPNSAKAQTIITSEEDLERHLLMAAKDLDGYDKWLYSATGSADPVLALISKLIVGSQTDVVEQLMQDSTKLGKAHAKYVKESGLGKNNTDKLNEPFLDTYDVTLEDGTTKTYYKAVEEYNTEEFRQAQAKFEKDNAHLLDSGREEDEEQYHQLLKEWNKENTQPLEKSKRDKVIQDHKDTLSEEEFNDWLADNTIQDSDGNITSYTNELVEPSDKYKSEKYEELQNNPAALEYYNTVMDLYNELLDKLPAGKKRLMRGKLPFVYKAGLIDRINSQGVSGAKKAVTDKFKITAADINYGIDSGSGYSKMIPIHYTSPIEVKDASTDILENMLAFAKSVRQYEAKAQILDEVQLAQSVISNQEVGVENAAGEVIEGGKSKKKVSNIEERLDSLLDTAYYGVEDEKKIIHFAGKDYSLDKAASNLSLATSVISLAGSVIGGISNLANGKMQKFIESSAGVFFTTKTAAKAEILADKHIPLALQDIGKTHDKSFLTQISEYFNFQTGEYLDAVNHNKSGNWFKKGLDISNMFAFMKGGEAMIAMSTGLSFLLDTKLVDGKFVQRSKYLSGLEGQERKDAAKAFEAIETNLLSAYEKKPDGVIGLKEEYKDAFSKDDLRDIRLMINGTNEKLQGNYSTETKAQIQRVWWGKLAIMYRKHLAPGFQRRFGEKNLNQATGQVEHGYYRSTGKFIFQKFLYKTLKETREMGFLEALSNNSTITELEKQNMRRAVSEVGLGFIMMFLVGALVGDEDDEDGKNTNSYAENLMALEARRLQGELLFYVNPFESMRILRSPAVSLSTVESVFRFGNGVIFIHGEEDEYAYDTGLHKAGDSKDMARLRRLVPIVKAIDDLRVPEEGIKIFNRNF